MLDITTQQPKFNIQSPAMSLRNPFQVLLLLFSLLASCSATSLLDLVWGRHWDDVRERLQTNPDEAKVADEFTRFPLTAACNRKAPIDVIAELLQIYSDAANAKTDVGDFPLHYLVNGGYGAPTVETVNLVIEANPNAVRIKDGYGDLPLHLAANNKDISCDVLAALVKVYPEGIFAEDNEGKTPFDWAKEKGNESKFQEPVLKVWESQKSDLEATTTGFDALKESNDKTLQQLKTLQQEKDELAINLRLAKGSIENLQNAKSKVEDKAGTLQREIDELEVHLGESKSTVKNLQDTKSQLEDKAGTLQREIDELEVHLGESKSTVENLQDAKRELELKAQICADEKLDLQSRVKTGWIGMSAALMSSALLIAIVATIVIVSVLCSQPKGPKPKHLDSLIDTVVRPYHTLDTFSGGEISEFKNDKAEFEKAKAVFENDKEWFKKEQAKLRDKKDEFEREKSNCLKLNQKFEEEKSEFEKDKADFEKTKAVFENDKEWFKKGQAKLREEKEEFEFEKSNRLKLSQILEMHEEIIEESNPNLKTKLASYVGF